MRYEDASVNESHTARRLLKEEKILLTENLFQNFVERSSPLSLPRINTLSSILAFAFSLGESFSFGAQTRAGEGRAPLKGDPPWKGDDDDDAYERFRVSMLS